MKLAVVLLAVAVVTVSVNAEIPEAWREILAPGVQCEQTNTGLTREIENKYYDNDQGTFNEDGILQIRGSPEYSCKESERPPVDPIALFSETDFSKFDWEEGCSEDEREVMENGVRLCDAVAIEKYTQADFKFFNKLLRNSANYLSTATSNIRGEKGMTKDHKFHILQYMPEHLAGIARLVTALNRIPNDLAIQLLKDMPDEGLPDEGNDEEHIAIPDKLKEVYRIDGAQRVKDEILRKCGPQGSGTFIFANFLSTTFGGSAFENSSPENALVRWEIKLASENSGATLIAPFSNMIDENEVLFLPMTTLRITNCEAIMARARLKLEKAQSLPIKVEAVEVIGNEPNTPSEVMPREPTVGGPSAGSAFRGRRFGGSSSEKDDSALVPTPPPSPKSASSTLTPTPPSGSGKGSSSNLTPTPPPRPKSSSSGDSETVLTPKPPSVPSRGSEVGSCQAPKEGWHRAKVAAGFKDQSGSWCYDDNTVVTTISPDSERHTPCSPQTNREIYCFITVGSKGPQLVKGTVKSVMSKVYSVQIHGSNNKPQNISCGKCT